MVHGPCGGVREDGGCELGDRPCAFLGAGAQVCFVNLSAPAAPGEELRVAAALALAGSALGGGA